MKRALKIASIFLMGSAWPACASPAEIIVGGDQNPDYIKSDYQALCGANVVKVALISDRNRPSYFGEISVNSKNIVNYPEYAELRKFISTLKFPYVTQINCSPTQVTIALSGRPLTGNDNFYRINIPIN